MKDQPLSVGRPAHLTALDTVQHRPTLKPLHLPSRQAADSLRKDSLATENKAGKAQHVALAETGPSARKGGSHVAGLLWSIGAPLTTFAATLRAQGSYSPMGRIAWSGGLVVAGVDAAVNVNRSYQAAKNGRTGAAIAYGLAVAGDAVMATGLRQNLSLQASILTPFIGIGLNTAGSLLGRALDE